LKHFFAFQFCHNTKISLELKLSEGFANFIAKVTRNWNICFYESPLTSEQRLSIKKTFTKHPSAFQFKAPHRSL